MAAFEHQDVPFASVVESLRGQQASDNLFHILFVFQNFPQPESALPGLRWQALEHEFVDTGTAKFDLTFHVWLHDGRLQTMAEYDSGALRCGHGGTVWGSSRGVVDSGRRGSRHMSFQIALDGSRGAARATGGTRRLGFCLPSRGVGARSLRPPGSGAAGGRGAPPRESPLDLWRAGTASCRFRCGATRPGSATGRTGGSLPGTEPRDGRSYFGDPSSWGGLRAAGPQLPSGPSGVSIGGFRSHSGHHRPAASGGSARGSSPADAGKSTGLAWSRRCPRCRPAQLSLLPT